MAARLVSLTDAPSIPIDKPVIFIGRDSECDVVLGDSRRVSRKHCCLAHVNNRLVARGEVVVVEDRLGVTMTEIIKSDKSPN